MMDEIKLLPCPFCGGEAKMVKGTECWGHGEYARYVGVRCSDCGCEAKEVDHKSEDELTEKVVGLWNTRKPVERVLERLEQELKFLEILESTEKRLASGEILYAMRVVIEEVG